MRMSVVLLNEETFMQRVADFRNPHTEWKYKGNRPAIVDFYATWCGPCRVLSPVLEEIASVYKGVVDVYKVDVDMCESVADAYGIRSIPTTFFVPLHGKPVKMVGAITKREIERQIAEVLLKDESHHAIV
jgi:thioredoxin